MQVQDPRRQHRIPISNVSCSSGALVSKHQVAPNFSVMSMSKTPGTTLQKFRKNDQEFHKQTVSTTAHITSEHRAKDFIHLYNGLSS